VSIRRLLVYAIAIAAGGLTLSLAVAAISQIPRNRAAFIVSVFITLFFAYAVVGVLTGFNGLFLLATYGGIMLLTCVAAWSLSSRVVVRQCWVAFLTITLALITGNYGLRAARLQFNGGLALGSAVSANTAHLDYLVLGKTAAILPADPARAKPTDGSSIRPCPCQSLLSHRQ
jgi:hypothetical protein